MNQNRIAAHYNRVHSAIRLYIRYLRGFLFSTTTPILVYQMGKVGSTSISNSLADHGLSLVFHVHRLNPDHIDQVRKHLVSMDVRTSSGRIGKMIYHQIAEHQHKTKVITLVRDPINRNISAFFENMTHLLPGEFIDNYSFRAYSQTFLKQYPHQVPLEWFEVEPKTVLGIDIYEYEFPKAEGYLEINQDHIDWLIIKSEAKNQVKGEAIRNFIGLPTFTIKDTNISQGKKFAQAYQHFKKTVQLPPSYIDKMMTANYTQHFYDDRELEVLWAQWL